jgi:hypothetical protein
MTSQYEQVLANHDHAWRVVVHGVHSELPEFRCDLCGVIWPVEDPDEPQR